MRKRKTIRLEDLIEYAYINELVADELIKEINQRVYYPEYNTDIFNEACDCWRYAEAAEIIATEFLLDGDKNKFTEVAQHPNFASGYDMSALINRHLEDYPRRENELLF